MRSRNGIMAQFISTMLIELQFGNKVAVVGCEDPKDLTERLKRLGIDVESEPMFKTERFKAIHNLHSIEGEVIDIEHGNKIQTGFVFYLKKEKL